MTKTNLTSSTNTRIRRQYTLEFKAQVIAQCQQPGVSVASVARLHGINDNLVHRWLRQQPSFTAKKKKSLATAAMLTPADFIPVAVMNSDIAKDKHAQGVTTISNQHFSISLTLGKLCIQVDWPMDHFSQSAQWLKGLSL